MQFSKLAIVAFLSGVTFAAPNGAGLAKRARESIHMAFCETYFSVNYYGDDTQDNSFPGNDNVCNPSNLAEGGSTSCTFGTGVSFSWHLDGNALNESPPAQVGGGSNGFHQFNCFRDDEHVLYTDGNGHQCHSRYVCFDA